MKKQIIFTCLLLFFILSISGVCASEDVNNSIQANTYDADFLSTYDSDALLVSDEDIISFSQNPSEDNGILQYNNEDDILGINIKSYNVTKYCGGPERFTAAVEDNDGNPIVNQSVKIKINGVEYERVTNDKGIASLALSLFPGEYKVTTSCNNIKSVSTVIILHTVNASDITKMFRNETQYYATFKDGSGNYAANGTAMSFNINGVFYERIVRGSDGKAKLNINLNPGNYIITATNLLNGERHSNNITVLPTIVENKDIVKYFKNGTQYLVKVIGNDGKLVGSGTDVKFNINGVFYTRTTNASSIAKLNINLNPGDYVITAEYNDYKVSNSIKVLKTLSAKDLTKMYGENDQFVVNLLDETGKPYSNQNITFNIHGVFYVRTTDNGGNAKLNIKLLPKTYVITSMYGDAVISNHVTVKPKEVSISGISIGADYIRSYYEDNGVLPDIVEVYPHTFTQSEFFYLMNKAIAQLGSSNMNDVAVVYGIKDVQPSSENTITSCFIKKSEYVKIAKDLTSKISKNNKVPATVSTSAGVVSYHDYVIISSRIMAFYLDYEGGLADYVTFVSEKIAHNFNYGMNSNPFGLPGKNVFIDADMGSTQKKLDLAMAFSAAGWNVIVGDTDSNAHYRDYFKVPSNYVLITIYNGFCAGTVRELASRSIQNVLKSKNCVCVPVWDSADWTNPEGMGPYRYGDFSGYSAERAWDDNFSVTDPAISNVAQYLKSNNIKYCTYPTTEGIMYQFANGGYSSSVFK